MNPNEQAGSDDLAARHDALVAAVRAYRKAREQWLEGAGMGISFAEFDRIYDELWSARAAMWEAAGLPVDGPCPGDSVRLSEC